MSYREYIISKAIDYKLHLLAELATDTRKEIIIDALFFPEGLGIVNWLTWTEVKSLSQYRYKGEYVINRLCNRDEIKLLPYHDVNFPEFDTYQVFNFLKCNNHENALSKFPLPYHLVKDDFAERIDELLFIRLTGFSQISRNIYSKNISPGISLTLNTKRENVHLKSISSYKLPSLSIAIRGEESIDFGTIDVRNLMLLPESSFLFFYSDSHSYIIDESLSTIKNVKLKPDEPIIYYSEKDNEYTISNSLESIEVYNKYIQIVLDLSIQSMNSFEKWLSGIIIENRIE